MGFFDATEDEIAEILARRAAMARRPTPRPDGPLPESVPASSSGVGRARPDLDLSDILTSYREFLGGSSTADINYVRPKGRVEGDQDYPDYHEDYSLFGGRSSIPSHLMENNLFSDEPYKGGHGPIQCSTVRTVALARPAFAWDTNYWYRRLGIPFPYVDAPKGALSRGYQAGDENDDRAMYALKMLLQPQIRAAYDAGPLGSVFMGDKYYMAWLKEQAMAEASRRSADGDYTDAATVLDEWGYDTHEDDDETVDTAVDLVQDQISHRQDNNTPTQWSYQYWIWRAKWRSDRVALMEQWQALLVRALSEAGLTIGLQVGIVGKQPHPYVVMHAEGSWIVYLNESTEPTQELADNATQALIAHKNRLDTHA